MTVEGTSQNRWAELNDPQAVEQMRMFSDSEYWELCSEFVHSMIDRLFSNSPDHLKEVIVQETLLRVHKYLAVFKRESNFTTWVLRIARNYAMDLHRQRKNREALEVYKDGAQQDSDSPEESDDNRYLFMATPRTPEELALLAERHREVCGWLQEYLQQHNKKERNRSILQLVLYDGYSYKEAAQKFGITEAVVGTVVRPAQEYLRSRIQQDTYGHLERSAQGRIQWSTSQRRLN